MSALRVVLADDQLQLRAELKALLEAYGIRVVGEAGNGRQLIDLLEGVSCDVVLLDLTMPISDGLQALATLARRPRTPPIVVLSVHDDAAHVDRALSLGASGYVLKSARTADLVAALQAAVAGGAYIQPSLARPMIDRHLALTGDPRRGSVVLSRRQEEMLRALAIGLRNKEIAHHLGLREETVKGYLSDLYAKIGSKGRASAVAWAMRHGIID